MDRQGSGCGLPTEESQPKDERKPDAATGERSLNDHTQQRIGLHLRAMYETIVQQPVPDRFRDLIARLDAASSETDSQA